MRIRPIDSTKFLHSLIENPEDRWFSTGSSRHPSATPENKALHTDFFDTVLNPESWPVASDERYGEGLHQTTVHV